MVLFLIYLSLFGGGWGRLGCNLASVSSKVSEILTGAFGIVNAMKVKIYGKTAIGWILTKKSG